MNVDGGGCEDRILDGPASGGKSSKGRNYLDCIWGKGVRRAPELLTMDARISQFENAYFTETCSGSEAGSYFRLIDFVDHSTLGSRVMKKKKREQLMSLGGVH